VTHSRVIVPLAGPDFVRSDGSLKGMHDYHGEPLLRHTLQTRPWVNSIDPEDYCFVMADRPETRTFARDEINAWYPEAKVVFLSNYTRGAALTALAGATMHQSEAEHLIVDLADIVYDSELDPAEAFAARPDAGGIALTFESENPLYSYLSQDENGRFAKAAEKRVISRNASAGTYIFASTTVFLKAIAHALENEADQTFNNLFYVCPLFNGVGNQGLDVLLHPVSNIRDIKMK